MATCLDWSLDKECSYNGIVHSTCYVEKCLPDAQRIQEKLQVEYSTDYEIPIPRMKIWKDCAVVTAVESPRKLVNDEDYYFSSPGVFKFRNDPQAQKEQLHQTTEQRACTELESDLPEDPREIIPDNLPTPTVTGPVLSALEEEAKVGASSLDEVYAELQNYDENKVSDTDIAKVHKVNGAGNFRVSTVRDLTKFSIVVHQKGDPYDVATETVAFGLGKTKSESFKIAAKLLILMFNQINCEL